MAMATDFTADSGYYAVIIPVWKEAEALPQVLAKLLQAMDNLPAFFAAGLNGCSDHSAEILRKKGITVAQAFKPETFIMLVNRK